MAPKERGRKVAATPAAIKKNTTQTPQQANPLYERRPKVFGVGNRPIPRKDMHRFVKWPKYVRLQRQRRILKMRLKVPPSINQFNRVFDRNQAEVLFKILMKYRPEDKSQKKQRLLAEAEARAGNMNVDKKKPIVVKYGLNHVTTLIESGKAQLVVIAHDVDPIELVVWLPALCKKMGVPYCVIKGKSRLGQIVHKKNAAALCLTAVKAEDQREFAKVVESAKSSFNEGSRVSWGGGILGQKSQQRIKKRERILAREQAQGRAQT